jgi:hypothetical protein
MTLPTVRNHTGIASALLDVKEKMCDTRDEGNTFRDWKTTATLTIDVPTPKQLATMEAAKTRTKLPAKNLRKESATTNLPSCGKTYDGIGDKNLPS